MNEEELKNLIREEVRNYFRQSFPGFEMVSNYETLGHGAGEFCLTTDSSQGIHWYKQGNAKVNSNKSFELYSGKNASEKDLAIGIHAHNGHVHIRALNGDLILEGKNVKIQATGPDGSVSTNATKTAYTKAPEIQSEATKQSHQSTLDYCVVAGFFEGHSEAGPASISSGDDEVLNPDFITQIVNFIDRVKKFFKSVCE